MYTYIYMYICYIYMLYIYVIYIEYVRATSEWELTNQETRGIESKPLRGLS